MGLRLVRQASEEPNIQNKDDVKMIRYAYGGYNGVVQGYGNELNSVTPSSDGLFKIGTGRVVLQGWEVDIEGAGWELPKESFSGKRYYSIYLEIVVATETAEIKSIHATSNYPEISVGDDLTEIPDGTARLLLYQISANNGVFVSANKKVERIPYLKDVNSDTEIKITSIEKRLNKLGFNEGVAEYTGFNSTSVLNLNSLKKQGKYVIFNFQLIGGVINSNKTATITIPKDFRPSNDVTVAVGAVVQNDLGITTETYSTFVLDAETGKITITPKAYVYSIAIINTGWETA